MKVEFERINSKEAERRLETAFELLFRYIREDADGKPEVSKEKAKLRRYTDGENILGN